MGWFQPRNSAGFLVTHNIVEVDEVSEAVGAAEEGIAHAVSSSVDHLISVGIGGARQVCEGPTACIKRTLIFLAFCSKRPLL